MGCPEMPRSVLFSNNGAGGLAMCDIEAALSQVSQIGADATNEIDKK